MIDFENHVRVLETLKNSLNFTQEHEAQAKAILTEESYQRLMQDVPRLLGNGVTGTAVQQRFRSGPGKPEDFRTRMFYDENDNPIEFSFVIKDHTTKDHITAKSRLVHHETVTQNCYVLVELIHQLLGTYHDPVWFKFKTDFHLSYDPSQSRIIPQSEHHDSRYPDRIEYRISIQRLWGQYSFMGYVLEGSKKLASQDEAPLHYANLVSIFTLLGQTPVDEAEFNAMVKDFIAQNNAPQ